MDDLLVQADIIANPHREPSAANNFIKSLASKLKRMTGQDIPPPQTDFAAIKAFKKKLKKESNMVKAN